MKTVEFQDINGTQIRVQLSGAGDIRIYLSDKDGKESGHLHMTHPQSQILICAIEDLMEAE